MSRSAWAASVLVVAITASVLMTATAQAAPQPSPRNQLSAMVVGGTDYLNPGYISALLLATITDPGAALFCGGTLISPTAVLTAAHCVEDLIPTDLDVAVGSTTLSEITPTERIPVTEIAVHPARQAATLTSTDIALLRLANPVTNKPPAPVVTGPLEPVLFRPLFLAGWGYVDQNRTSLLDTLQGADVMALTDTLTDWSTAALQCGVADTTDDFCFGASTAGPCQGDSGGPILGETFVGSGTFEVVGVVSFGPASQCLSSEMFDGGQRLSPYKTWIDATVNAWSPPPTPPPTVLSTPLPLTPPGVPTVEPGDTTSTVSWTPPVDDGGDPNLTYVVTGTPAGTCTTVATTCQIADLINGVSYSFTVTATNTTGTSLPSPPSTAVMGATLVNCTSATPPFVDVPDTSFARNDIGCIANLGVTTGTSPGMFSPANPVTREQMAAFIARLYRAITGSDCGSDPIQFVDVPDTSFARNDIGCIANLGVTTGMTPSTYAPDDTVTREQMAAFIARLYRKILTPNRHFELLPAGS